MIQEIDKYKNEQEFTDLEMRNSAKDLAKYDVVFISYWNMTAHLMAFMHGVEKLFGTKLVIDVDDDIYDIPYYNPIWLKVNSQEVEDYKTIINIAPYVTTTNEHLATKIRKNKKSGEVYVLPNYIPDDYKHKAIDNGDKLVIGYFGGASHYRDLHNTGLLPALRKIMHEHKNVYFECVGQPIDDYLPRARVKIIEAVNGTLWPDKLFPALNFDIALAPLEDDEFARSKSNIKWQEATRMGAAFIGSDSGPYKSLKKGTALLTPNTEDAWYIALQTLVEEKDRRGRQLKAAQKELLNWRLEDHWREYMEMFGNVRA